MDLSGDRWSHSCQVGRPRGAQGSPLPPSWQLGGGGLGLHIDLFLELDQPGGWAHPEKPLLRPSSLDP